MLSHCVKTVNMRKYNKLQAIHRQAIRTLVNCNANEAFYQGAMKYQTLYLKPVFLVVFLIAFLLATSCAPHRKNTYGRGVYHTVKPGQTLYRISLTYQVPLKTITRTNRISDPAKIEVGQRIFIPGARRVLEVAVFKSSLVGFNALPANGQITSYYGVPRRHGKHTGIDISDAPNAPIYAVLPGVVTYSGRLSAYGLMVKIRHADGFESLYAHNSKNLVKPGDRVKKGQKIALMGKSGNARGYHVHFEIRKNGKPVNPLTYLNAK